MRRSFVLNDETHIPREMQGRVIDDDAVVEGHEEKPLPIDLAYCLSDDPVTWQQLAPACWAAVVGLAVAILGSFAILWVVYG